MLIEQEVITLIADKMGLKLERIRPEMTFYQLGIDGDDAVELVEACCERFGIDPEEIDLARYTIGPEGWGLNLAPIPSLSLKFASPDPVDLRVQDLIRSAEAHRWFDPVTNRGANW